MIVLGIDPSLTGTGLCVLDDKYTILHISTLKNKLRGIDRLIFIRNEVLGITKQFNPEFVVLEGYAMGIRGGMVFNLGELGGVLRTAIYEHGLSYIDVPPTMLKKVVCGKGNADKNILLEQTFRRYGVGSETLFDDNQVDAYGLARLGIDYLKFSNGEKTTRELQETFAKLERIVPPPTTLKKGITNKCNVDKNIP